MNMYENLQSYRLIVTGTTAIHQVTYMQGGLKNGLEELPAQLSPNQVVDEGRSIDM
ncbi:MULTISPECIES: hypothetical protein [unclassified Spirosoma]|uniref:hypothetical protein n=1 Tax=unclassified Spirosoma TaxID=2621999 RepID=UPI000A47CC0B|nr:MULTISPECIES: hypothetical protein [unclassified Spirosoma]MBN8824745.1 hypothetical protein [Spirosoma sp.]